MCHIIIKVLIAYVKSLSRYYQGVKRIDDDGTHRKIFTIIKILAIFIFIEWNKFHLAHYQQYESVGQEE